MAPPLGGSHRPLAHLAILSIFAALTTLVLKFGAYALTGSAGLLSDAVESTANLVAAVTALVALWYAARPVDRSHTYGHEKIEFFASGIEGSLILVAASGIAWFAVDRLVDPRPIDAIGIGTVVTLVASAVNLGVGWLLLREGREHNSLILEADGRHLMTDVWTSLGVVVGLILVRITGIERLDPIVALIIAVNVVRTGVALIHTAVDGLMDHALPAPEQAVVRQAIEGELVAGMAYHALRTRRAGARRFAEFHLLVPGRLSVREAHALTNRIENVVGTKVAGAETTVHVEPIEERDAWQDSALVEFESETLPEEMSATGHTPGV